MSTEYGTGRLRRALASRLRRILDDIRGNYYLVAAAEPVLQLLEPGVSWVVEGRYGPTLVSRNLAIWDVDSIHGINGWDTADPAFNRLPPPSDEKVLLIVRDRLQQKAISGSFRIYRTFGGVRVICTCQPYPGPDGWFREVGEALRADPAYMQISARQKCSRARLKPKSAEWRMDADKGNGPRRACRFIGISGSNAWLGLVADQIDLHDRETQATNTNNLRLY